jgi:hypothetical protein
VPVSELLLTLALITAVLKVMVEVRWDPLTQTIHRFLWRNSKVYDDTDMLKLGVR